MDISIEQTLDEEYIHSMLTDPAIFESMRDDSCPKSPQEVLFPPLALMGGYFLKVINAGKECGLFWFRPVEGGLEAHTALLPSCRGRSAIMAGKMAVKWVFDNTGFSRITSYSWSDSPAIDWFCRQVGLTPFDTKPWPNTRNGNPVDVTYFQIQRA